MTIKAIDKEADYNLSMKRLSIILMQKKAPQMEMNLSVWRY